MRLAFLTGVFIGLLILACLLLATSTFAQLQLGSGTNITATVTNADTIAAWVYDGSEWHHYASNSTGTFVDGLTNAWSVTPWTYDGTNLVVGETNIYVDAVTARTNALTTNQLAHYVLNTAHRYNMPLSQDTNLLAIAEPWDYGSGNDSCLLALDTENVGVAAGVVLDGYGSLTNGLVAYWSMDSVSSNTVFDTWGSNDGTAVGTPTYSAGKNQDAVNLNGSSQWVDHGNPASLNFGTGSFTVSLWFYRNPAVQNNRRLLAKGATDNTAAQAGFSFWGGNSEVSFAVNPSGTRTILTTDSGATTTNQWIHLAGVLNRSSNMELYVNGSKLKETSAPSGSVTSAQTFYLGRPNFVDATLYWTGSIDEVSIWSRALSSNEVSELYNNQVGKFYGAAPIRDRSSYANDAVANGSPVHVMPDRGWGWAQATGGTVTNYTDAGGTNWTAHIFTTVGISELTVTKGGEVEYLVVGGGGNGGDRTGGGGGAGDFRSGSIVLSSSAAITVGSGGTPSGSLSSFGDIVAIGGGAGTTYTAGNDGGSGGGVSGVNSGGLAVGAGQGNNGGDSVVPALGRYVSSGGGGAGAVGGNAVEAGLHSGDGGAGLSSTITGQLKWYAGGGGGGTLAGGGSAGSGGIGGGGNGGLGVNGSSATANTGGGGGGGGQVGNNTCFGGAGGSGIVVIRYRRAR